ncbi:hypothetical protein [Psittacicella hinzii]|nr:hypothetical protein [Psittacicella hinzii]
MHAIHNRIEHKVKVTEISVEDQTNLFLFRSYEYQVQGLLNTPLVSDDELKKYQELLCQNLGKVELSNNCFIFLQNLLTSQARDFGEVANSIFAFLNNSVTYPNLALEFSQNIRREVASTPKARYVILLLLFKEVENSLNFFRNELFSLESKVHKVKFSNTPQQINQENFISPYFRIGTRIDRLQPVGEGILNSPWFTNFNFSDKAKEVSLKNVDILYTNFQHLLNFYLDQDISSSYLVSHDKSIDFSKIERYLLQKMILIHLGILSDILDYFVTNKDSYQLIEQRLIQGITFSWQDPELISGRINKISKWFDFLKDKLN